MVVVVVLKVKGGDVIIIEDCMSPQGRELQGGQRVAGVEMAGA